MPLFRRDQQDPYPSPQVQPTTRRSVTPAAEPAVKENRPAPVAVAAPSDKVETATAQSIATPVKRDAAAVIDKKSEITGTLHSQGNVLIEGGFQGEIEAKETVWVEKGAQVQAQLNANDVIISGTFNGEIDCKHRLHIASTATISGEIRTPVLVVEEGSTVNCRFSMTRSQR